MAFGCSGAELEPELLALTIVAQTSSASTPRPSPSRTPAPSATPPVTPTAMPPTASPTASPTLGPIVFMDDFAESSENWLNCRGCEWADGRLLMGPYPPGATIERSSTACGPCADSSRFRIAVDVTHVEGQTDRGYGLGFWWDEQGLWSFEISPLFLLTVGFRYDLIADTVEITNPNPEQLLSGLVKPGYATNRLEIRVEPAGADTADVYFRVNDRNAFVLYNRPLRTGRVGLVVGFHSIRVAFDNFEFEQLDG
jgi:hypothetical protein